MRTLRRRGDPNHPNRLTVAVAVRDGEELDGPGEVVGLGELGACRILAVRRVDSPEPGLQPGEHVMAIDVETLETSGDVPDSPFTPRIVQDKTGQP